MAKNYFISDNYDDLIKVNQAIISWFKEKQYQIESSIFQEKYFIQARKTGVIRTLLGANLAFQVIIYLSTDDNLEKELIVETSIGKWITNIAGAGFTSIFMGGIPILTGLANAGWALMLETDLISYLQNNLNLKKVTKIENNSSENSFDSSNIYSGKNDENYIKVKTEEELKEEAELLLEKKIAKLQKAFEEGILDSIEYEEKLEELYNSLNIETANKKQDEIQKEKIAKLKQAFNDGILTEEEYLRKIHQD
jgi:hypothetical protein